MYLRRKVDDFLMQWKNDPEHRPLVIKGARQVGKTETIMQFARKNYRSVVSINFALERKYLTITHDGYDVASVVKNISFIDPAKEFIPGETIIIFDEFQDNPDIATALKSFREDGRYDVICSGSLLGINYRKIHSNGVGNKTDP